MSKLSGSNSLMMQIDRRKLRAALLLSLIPGGMAAGSYVVARTTETTNAAAQISSNTMPALAPQTASDGALAQVRSLDRIARPADGKLALLSPAEHLRRAGVYIVNRAFDEARLHYQALIDRYPNDPKIPAALYGIGRSFFQTRRYNESLPFFERLAREYTFTQEGRDGLSNLAAALLRLERAGEAATRYIEYIGKFPQGERIESSYLNVIDAYREANAPNDAIAWIARTRARFPNSATDTNAVFARLRLDIAGGDWQHAIQTADELRRASLFAKNVATSSSEVAYLRAYSLERLRAYGLERAGRADEAINAYLAIPDTPASYYGAQATAKLLTSNNITARAIVAARISTVDNSIVSAQSLYPAPYRETIARLARARNIDPRLVLAIMRQESNFRARAKSNAAARGLLQLTIDSAQKYAVRAGYPNLQEDDLYNPTIAIAVGCEYIADLARQFPDQPEAVVASYNGGEDNAARWLKRARQNDPGVFASEVGFAETKDYVFKVMSNYRAYKRLYTITLSPR
ncbi:MAG: transglycosylase SLT domain-containing protein [Pyrinomonadaceae bacterium]